MRKHQRVSINCLALFCLLSACAPQTPRLAEIGDGHWEIVDLSYALNEKSPYWPGDGYIPFQFETIATLEEDGVFSGAFSMPEHLGTHIDSPNHFGAGQISVDKIPFKDLVAPAVVLDVREGVSDSPDYQVGRDDLEGWEFQFGRIPPRAVVFALTGWGAYWGDFQQYKNEDSAGQLHFPGFAAEAAQFLIRERHIKGIGIDTLSVDYGLSTRFPVHHLVNGAGGYHLENVANLGGLPLQGSWVIIAPVKVDAGSGGPTRIWGIFPRR